MSTAKAILFGVLLMACAFMLAQGLPVAQAFTGGPYQLTPHSNTTANVGVFRINTTTGEVSYCFLDLSSNLVCTRAVR